MTTERMSEPESDGEMTADVAESGSNCLSEPINYDNLDAEKVLEGFGTFGLYQVCFLFLFFEKCNY